MPHTPGPWKVSELDRRCVEGPDELVIADIRSWKDTDDARLIAAAPEMLEALKIAYEVSLRYSKIECGVRSSDVDWVSMTKNFLAIIRKAEGK